MYWISVLFLIAMFVPLSLSLICMPYLTRETVSFGVSVSEAVYHSAAARHAQAVCMDQLSRIWRAVNRLPLRHADCAGKAAAFHHLGICSAADRCFGSYQSDFYTKMKRFKATLPRRR